MNNKRTLIAYFGHHKCATSWINAIIYPLCRDLNLKYTNVHNPGMFGNNLDSFCIENKIEFLSYTNAEYQYIKDINDLLGFHVIRDPRDIVISAYFSHLHSHSSESWPELVEHRKKLENSTLEDGLFLEMEFRRKEFDAMYNWDYSQTNILELKMEDLIISPYETMVNAFSYLGLVKDSVSIRHRLFFLVMSGINKISKKCIGFAPLHSSNGTIPVDYLLGYIYKNRFSEKSKGRQQGEEDVTSHYRKGVAGDWVNYFNQEHRIYFKEKYNDLLIKLGYENSTDW